MFQALPRYQTHIQLTGLALATVALIGSAFATKVSRLGLRLGGAENCSHGTSSFG